jgi:protoporphyrin/coproporphyrin ferrochelatase
MNYDALLVVSFGGPESRDDVIPFLENVLRGRNVPRERMQAVAEHYYHFDGKSPINQQIRELIAAVERELAQHDPKQHDPKQHDPNQHDPNQHESKQQRPKLPVYWGNRNWHPMLRDTLRQMKQDGIRRALAFVTSAYSSYSGCRQYREDIARAQSELGADSLENPSPVPVIDKLRPFFNHPAFLEATEERLRDALREIPENARQNIQLVYTAHSIPTAMANTCDYVRQLEEVRKLVSSRLGISNDVLVYQSRSGAPGQPWLEPDVLNHLRAVKARNHASAVVLAPISFISDHMEVLYDLDIEARQLCESLNLPMARAQTVGIHPKFVAMIRELILERMNPNLERRALGSLGPRQDLCAEDCCPAPQRPTRTHA